MDNQQFYEKTRDEMVEYRSNIVAVSAQIQFQTVKGIKTHCPDQETKNILAREISLLAQMMRREAENLMDAADKLFGNEEENE